MLDVHPPEHAAHTWRDFFIHIATIVVGLIIAVGLEQTVEAIHHRHQLHQSREALRGEMLQDRNIFQQNIDLLQRAEASMQHNAALLRAPANQPTSDLNYSWDILYARSNAWEDAKLDGSLNRMTPGERDLLDRIYSGILQSQSFELAYLADANTCRSIAHRTAKISDLSPAERQELLNATSQTEGQLVSARTLMTFSSQPMKAYLDQSESH